MNEAEVRRMSQAERRQLASILTELDGPTPEAPDQPDPFLSYPELRRQRQLALIVLTSCCVILGVWIVAAAGPGARPSLRDTPLSGSGVGEVFSRRRAHEHAERARSA